MQNLRHTFVRCTTYLSFIFLTTISLSLTSGLPFLPSDIPDLTEEERAAFELIGSLDEKELGQLIEKIEEDFAKLSKEEKEKMLNEIDKEAQRLQGKINQYYEDQGLPPMTPPEPMKPEPVTPPVQPKPTEKPEVTKEKKELLSKRIAAVEALIARILQVIEKYIITGQTIPDFDDQIEQWGKSEEIKNWKRGLNWVLFKDDLDALVRKLHKVKDRDPNTKQYKFLEDVVKDETLYNNLGYLDRGLQQQGSALQGVSLETGALPSQAEMAIKEVTGLLAEALYQLNIPAGLDKAIEPYQKEAAERKAKQEEYEKQAYAESKRMRPVRPVYVVGQEPEEYGGVTVPAAPVIKRPAYQPPAARQKAKQVAKRQEKKPAPLSGPASKGAKKPKDKKKPDDKKKAADAKKEKAKEDKASEGFLQKVATGLSKAMSTLDREFGRIKQNILDKKIPVNESLVKTVVPQVTKQADEAAESAEALRARLKGTALSKEQKNVYSKALKDEIKSQAKDIIAISNDLKQLRRNVGSMAPEKAYAYFGGEVISSDKEKIEELKKLPVTNLGNLESALERIMAALK